MITVQPDPNTRTYLDGSGAWHCEVTLPAAAHRLTARFAALAAVTTEIRARNPRDLLTGLTFVGQRTAGDFIITHWREEDGS